MDLLASSALVVDSTGRRFVDEGLGGVAMANAIAKLDDPLSSFLIMNAAIWEAAGRDFLLPPTLRSPNAVS
jgi:fumarate reductase flavoprotein subunit